MRERGELTVSSTRTSRKKEIKSLWPSPLLLFLPFAITSSPPTRWTLLPSWPSPSSSFSLSPLPSTPRKPRRSVLLLPPLPKTGGQIRVNWSLLPTMQNGCSSIVLTVQVHPPLLSPPLSSSLHPLPLLSAFIPPHLLIPSHPMTSNITIPTPPISPLCSLFIHKIIYSFIFLYLFVYFFVYLSLFVFLLCLFLFIL